MATRATYVPGGWVAVAAPGVWLLVDLPPEHELVGRCWSLAAAGLADVDSVLDVLAAGGVSTAPQFALVAHDGVGARVIVRGDARVVTADDVVSAPAHRSWTDVDLVADSLALQAGRPAGGVTLPMASGVTMAGAVTITVDDRDEDVAPPRRADDVDVDEPTLPIAAPLPQDETADAPEAAPVPDPRPAPEPAVSPEPEPASPPPPAEPSQPATESAGDEPEPDGGAYDHLFGATQRPGTLPTLPPEPSPPAEPTVAPEPAVPVAPTPRDLTATWLPAEATDRAEAAPGEAIIDAVPGSAPSPAPAPTMPERSDVTVTRATPRLPAPVDPQPEIVGPTVVAGRCPEGHLSPAHADRCRVCGAPMPQQEGVVIARPPLGVLRLSTGDSVTLDRGVYFGRAPQAADDEADQPHIVRLASPDNDISRNHARIELEGWLAYVTDLDSTNGTTVTLPGREPERLRPHTAQLLENQAQICFADEVTVIFEVTG